MPKYTVIQSYTVQDIYKNVEAVDIEDAINKIGGLPVDENNHEDTETEVKLEEEWWKAKKILSEKLENY